MNMPNHVSTRDCAQKKTKQKHCTVKFADPRRGGWWGLEGTAGGVGLEDDAIGSLISANVAEIKGKAVGRGDRMREIRRDEGRGGVFDVEEAA